MGANHDENCVGNRQYVVIGVLVGVAGLVMNSIKGSGNTVEEALKDVVKKQEEDRLRYAPDGICTAPAGGCGFGARKYKRPAKVQPDRTLICHCGSPMKPRPRK
jgi:hypothetical protein